MSYMKDLYLKVEETCNVCQAHREGVLCDNCFVVIKMGKKMFTLSGSTKEVVAIRTLQGGSHGRFSDVPKKGKKIKRRAVQQPTVL